MMGMGPILRSKPTGSPWQQPGFIPERTCIMSINFKSMFTSVVKTVATASDKYESVCNKAEAKLMKSLGSEKTLDEVVNAGLDKISLESIKRHDKTIMTAVAATSVAAGVVASSALIGAGVAAAGTGALAVSKIKKNTDTKTVVAKKETDMERVCREAYELVAEQHNTEEV